MDKCENILYDLALLRDDFSSVFDYIGEALDVLYRLEAEVNKLQKEEKVKVIAELGPFTFGPLTPNWSRDADINEFFFKMSINHLKERLDRYDVLTLNDALDSFGFHRIKEGYTYCWTKSDDISSLISIKVIDPDARIYEFYFKMTKNVNDL